MEKDRENEDLQIRVSTVEEGAENSQGLIVRAKPGRELRPEVC
jgi:hypothetical protein